MINIYLFGGRGRGSGSVRGVNYYKANKFLKFSVDEHYINHGKNTNSKTKKDYINKSLKLANSNSKNVESFVNLNGTTYRYNIKTNEFVIVIKNGEVVIYFKPRAGKNTGKE